MGPKEIIVIILGVLAVPAIILFFIKLKQRQDEVKALIEKKFRHKKIILRDPIAFFIAQQSRGYSQRQGNGNLILTEDELFLVLTVPYVLISIPVQNIGEMQRVSRMNGQQPLGRKMLKIHYMDNQGNEDALGIRLKQVDQWEAEIRKLQARSTSPTLVAASQFHP